MKKAQIATTITWFVVYSLILFIIFIFLFFAISSRAAKEINFADVVSDYGENEISIDKSFVKSLDIKLSNEANSVFFDYIEYEGKKMKFYDLLSYYFENSDENAFLFIENKISNEFDVLYNGCYSVCLNSKKEINKFSQINGNACNLFYESCEYIDNANLDENVLSAEYRRKVNGEDFKIKMYVEVKNE